MENNNSSCYCQLGVFSKEEFKLHRNETRFLLKEIEHEKIETADGFTFTYQGSEKLLQRIASWVTREQKCCPWAKFKLESEALSQYLLRIVLTVSGGGNEGKKVFSEGLKALEML